jgi:hypothetical protein
MSAGKLDFGLWVTAGWSLFSACPLAIAGKLEFGLWVTAGWS